MREIKFRVWDKVIKVMRDVLSIDFEKQEVICPPRGHKFSEWYNQNLPFNEVLILQNTGLKDKNGKEIYEGDILLLHQFLFDGHEFENELIGEVVYDQETCSFALRNIRNADVKKYMGYKEHEDCGNIPIFNFYGLHEESFEKLGDIYENPELLEGGFK